ncbi:MAG: hypothetical protein ACRCYO_01560, partial [Bacteroidia bacterium]
MRNFLFILWCLFPFLLRAQPFEIKQLCASKVTCFETIELGLKVPAFERLLQNYSTGNEPSRNPYRASEIAIQVAFSNGKTHYIVDAFYYESPVFYPTGNSMDTKYAEWPFRVRFCPPDTGL